MIDILFKRIHPLIPISGRIRATFFETFLETFLEIPDP